MTVWSIRARERARNQPCPFVRMIAMLATRGTEWSLGEIENAVFVSNSALLRSFVT
jgi:hypothetical protein